MQPNAQTADAIVVGAGIIGATTAIALVEAGLSVCLVDRADGPALGASYANGAQLSYAYSDALAAPALLRKLPRLALGLDPFFRLKPSADPALYAWLFGFLRNMTASHFERNTLAVLSLALESQAAMHRLLARHKIAFDHATPGKMHLYYDRAALDGAAATVALKRRADVEQHILNRREAIDHEPALAQVEGLAGVVYAPHDAVGDAYLFARALIQIGTLSGQLVTQFGFDVRNIARTRQNISVLAADGRSIAGRRLILCGGIANSVLGRRIGARLPIQPIKGYSFTALPGADAPRVSLTDTKRKLVLCRLGDRLRVAGLSELGNSSTDVDPRQSALLERLAHEALPKAIAPGSITKRWSGLRPMTPFSGPIIRWLDSALAINSGHGMLGWTLAMGSAYRLVQSMPSLAD